jgi:hypothetical protein
MDYPAIIMRSDIKGSLRAHEYPGAEAHTTFDLTNCGFGGGTGVIADGIEVDADGALVSVSKPGVIRIEGRGNLGPFGPDSAPEEILQRSPVVSGDLRFTFRDSGAKFDLPIGEMALYNLQPTFGEWRFQPQGDG